LSRRGSTEDQALHLHDDATDDELAGVGRNMQRYLTGRMLRPGARTELRRALHVPADDEDEI
jgi:hypothetical protein